MGEQVEQATSKEGFKKVYTKSGEPLDRIPQFSLGIHAKKASRGDCGKGGPHQVLMYHQSEYFHQFYKIIELVGHITFEDKHAFPNDVKTQGHERLY